MLPCQITCTAIVVKNRNGKEKGGKKKSMTEARSLEGEENKQEPHARIWSGSRLEYLKGKPKRKWLWGKWALKGT